MSDPAILSEPEAAAALRVHAKTLARWRRAGLVAHERTPGGRIRYHMEDLVTLKLAMRVSSHAPERSNKSGEVEPPPA